MYCNVLKILTDYRRAWECVNHYQRELDEAKALLNLTDEQLRMYYPHLTPSLVNTMILDRHNRLSVVSKELKAIAPAYERNVNVLGEPEASMLCRFARKRLMKVEIGWLSYPIGEVPCHVNERLKLAQEQYRDASSFWSERLFLLPPGVMGTMI